MGCHFCWQKMHKILLQRRFLSCIFTPIYDLVIDSLADPEAKKIVRQLIREEYPDAKGKLPSHREDLVHDLLQLGISTSDIFAARPSRSTQNIIKQSFQFIYRANNHTPKSLRDLELMLMVRFWGEILVSTEYGCMWAKLSEHLHEGNSRFYYPHFVHDQKRTALQSNTAGLLTHTDRTNALLMKYLQSEGAIQHFKAKEMELFKKGKLKTTTAEDFLNEL